MVALLVGLLAFFDREDFFLAPGFGASGFGTAVVAGGMQLPRRDSPQRMVQHAHAAAKKQGFEQQQVA